MWKIIVNEVDFICKRSVQKIYYVSNYNVAERFTRLKNRQLFVHSAYIIKA